MVRDVEADRHAAPGHLCNAWERETADRKPRHCVRSTGRGVLTPEPRSGLRLPLDVSGGNSFTLILSQGPIFLLPGAEKIRWRE